MLLLLSNIRLLLFLLIFIGLWLVLLFSEVLVIDLLVSVAAPTLWNTLSVSIRDTD